jgi:putative transposase
MPRRARLRIAGIPLHVVQRGHDRAACFFAPADYDFYLRHLAEFAERFECALHAYVLMTNHVHLLLTPAKDDGATLLMKHLGQRYVQYVNRSYARRGTLWEGRFRSTFVERCAYLLKCQRYIELNPVRARMVSDPADYAWSSHRANIEPRVTTFLAPHEDYLSLGSTPAERAMLYRSYFQYELDAADLREIRAASTGGFALGKPRFQAQVAEMVGRRVERLRRRAAS